MNKIRSEFKNHKYVITANLKEVETEVLKNELKALRHTWVIQLKLGNHNASNSLLTCINQISSELKGRK